MKTNKTMKKVNINPVLIVMIFILMLTLILMLATVVNAQDSDTSQLHVCVNANSGLARFVGPEVECRSAEYPIVWNIEGPQGPSGDPFLYGQFCPEDTYMTGITEDGYIICNNIPTGGGGGEDPPTNLCGNDVLDPGEQCDDGNTQNGDLCAWDCTIELSCGTDETSCSGSCTNLRFDPNNCGVCGNICASGTCTEGDCVENPPLIWFVDFVYVYDPANNVCGELSINGDNFTQYSLVYVIGQTTGDSVELGVTFVGSDLLIATISCDSSLQSDIYDVRVTNGLNSDDTVSSVFTIP